MEWNHFNGIFNGKILHRNVLIYGMEFSTESMTGVNDFISILWN